MLAKLGMESVELETTHIQGASVPIHQCSQLSWNCIQISTDN